MKPFAAWLAMGPNQEPRQYYSVRGWTFEAHPDERGATTNGNPPPQRVLIVPDTEENRRKLGMEEA